MVIKGKPRGNGAQLAGYLMKKADNDNIRVLEIRGTCQDNVHGALVEMSLTSELTKSNQGLYHAQINPAYGEDKQMSSEDWNRAADILEDQLKLQDQKRVIVLHEKKDRTHAHVIWERYDHETGTMISDSFSRLAQDRARKQIEEELKQEKTPHRNQRQPEIKQVLTDLWKKTVTGADFIKESIQKGYTIAKGELRRPFMVVDDTGRSFDLVRQLTGIRTKEVRERLKNEKLQTEREVISGIRAKQLADKKEKSESQSAIFLQPGYWNKRFEQKQAEDLKAYKELEKERIMRELQEQLNRKRQQERTR